MFHQGIDGFGASDAWQCAIVGEHWPLEKRERIADLLFSQAVDPCGRPVGIGLSLWRSNLGAGTAEQGDASGIGNPWRRAECFLDPDGRFDGTRQAGQRWFLEAAGRRGVETFLAFANSPPVPFTRNDKGYASPGDRGLNLRPDRLADYTAYLADVLEHFRGQGTPFAYLSPVNEPQWNWDQPGQEGTPALNAEVHALVVALSRRLQQRGLDTRLVIAEAGSIGHVMGPMAGDGRDDQARAFFSPSSPHYVGDLPNVAPIIAAHSYHSVWPPEAQVEHRRRLHDAIRAVAPGLGYWMSEYCILEQNPEIGGGNGRDLGMDTALFVARVIHHDLVIAQARSWQWWTAVSQVDYKDGLVHLDDGSAGDTGAMGPEVLSLMRDGEVRESKLLWVLGNYARFVRPGMVRIPCEVAPVQSCADGLLASAYRDAGGAIVVVLVNQARREVLCDLGMPVMADTYTTSATASLEPNRQPASGLTVPARAVVTALLAPAAGGRSSC